MMLGRCKQYDRTGAALCSLAECLQTKHGTFSHEVTLPLFCHPHHTPTHNTRLQTPEVLDSPEVIIVTFFVYSIAKLVYKDIM